MNPYTINPPESDAIFEELCLALLKNHWSRSGLQRFGRKGERQYGVDILDTFGESPLYAAQCKLKEQTKSLGPAEIEEEVGKAKTFPSKLDHYAILTTGKVSTEAQLTIQAINQEHRAKGLFIVELFAWNRITELIRQYPEIEQRFYGGLRPEEVAAVNSKLDHITNLAEIVAANSGTSEIDRMIDEARDRINSKDYQLAVLLLNRVLQTRGSELSQWHRFRILTNLGAAHLMLGKGTEAAKYFLDARPFQPEDQLAVANEVLAYYLLQDEEQARTKAANAIERFPNSTRLRALWIQSASQETSYKELLDATPSHMRKDAEVASALCRRAMAEGLLGYGIEHAKDAVADKPTWSEARLLLAQAHFAKVAIADRSIAPLKVSDQDVSLASAITAADETIRTADVEGVSHVKAQALALCSDIALLQGRKDEGARLAREALAADPKELCGHLSLAQAAFSRGDLNEGIAILEQAYAQADSALNVSFMLGQALMARGKEQDLSRAIEVLSCAKVAGLRRELNDPIVIATVRALVRAKRFAEIPAYIARREVAASPVLVEITKGYAALKQSLNEEANLFLNDATALRRETDTASITDFLARTLMEAGRLSDALPLLIELFNARVPNYDVGLLLNCAARLNQVKVILDTCQTLYDRGVRDWEFQEFESQYLEEYDFQKAIDRLHNFVKENPDHRIAKLRLAIVGMRYGRADLAQVSEATLPPPEELPMRYAVAAVQMLQWQEKGKLVVDYAYRLLRSHISEFEAHKAYLASLLPGSRPIDIPATMETVEVGTAVHYSEGGVPVGWFVIENTDSPNSDFEEIPASSDIAKGLLGKKVGDAFVLAKSSIKDRVGTITQILSKYTRRFQAVGEQMQLKFGEQSVIQTIRVPPPEQLTAADLQPILDDVKARSETVSRLREIYRTTPITLHMYGDALGHNAHEAILDLAGSEQDSVQCARPQAEALANAMASLRSKSTVVLDLTSLGSLRLLGITRQVLTGGSFRFVISPATYTELQQFRVEARYSTAHGTFAYKEGQHYVTRTSEEEAQKQKTVYEEWMQCVEQNSTVVPVPEVAALPPNRREDLEQLFGRAGLESTLLALSPGYVLWTDDLAFAEVATTEFGTERVWTQAVVEHIANLGIIDRASADEAHAKLVGFDYQATHYTGGVMIAGLRISNGSTEAFPMRQIIRAFGQVHSVNMSASFRLLAEFALKVYVEPMLPETKCLAMKTLLDTFPSDSQTKRQLAAFRSQCAQLFALNPLAQKDFTKCFDEWNRQKLRIAPFQPE